MVSRADLTVIITTYNQENFIKRALRSVLTQTILPSKVIIADDDSSDRTIDEAKSVITDFDAIEIIKQPKNLGVSQNRNSALNKVVSKYVCFLDADDWFLPLKIESEYLFIEKLHADIVFSNYLISNDGTTNLSTPNVVWKANLSEGTYSSLFLDVLKRNISSKALFRNEIIRTDLAKTELFCPEYNVYEDWDYKLRLSRKATYAYLDSINQVYLNNTQGLSRQNNLLKLQTEMKILWQFWSFLGNEERKYVSEKICWSRFWTLSIKERLIFFMKFCRAPIKTLKVFYGFY